MANHNKANVSVVMITLDGADYVAKQLQSIAAQTCAPAEIIISDDGSTDGTLEILQSINTDIPTYFFSRAKPLGINANIAFALQHCRGEFIAISDQDDIWEPEKIELLVSSIGNADAIFSDSSFIDENDQPLATTLIQRLASGRIPRIGTRPLRTLLKNVVSGHALLFRRSLLPGILPLTNTCLYDQQIAIAASVANGISYIDQALVRHRQHGKNSQNHILQKPKRNNSRREDRYQRKAKQLCNTVNYAHSIINRMQNTNPDCLQICRLNRLLNSKQIVARAEIFVFLLRHCRELFFFSPNRSYLKQSIRLGLALLRENAGTLQTSNTTA